MFCHNCGKEIQEGAKFCPNCGKATNIVASIKGNVLPCPYCGSTDITKIEKPSKAQAYLSFGFAFLLFCYFLPDLNRFFIMRMLLVLFFVLLGCSYYFRRKSILKEWDATKWMLTCNTCKKNFKIDPPDGSQIITNIKSEQE